MDQDYKLCDVCSGLDFGPSVERRWFEHDLQPLGTTANIMKRSSRCILCAFLVQHCQDAIMHPFRSAEYVHVSLRRSNVGSRPSNLNDSNTKDQQVHVNAFEIVCKPWLGLDFQLVPCLVPVPSVQTYLNSTNIYLDHEARSFSGRIMEPMASVKLVRKWLDLCIQFHGGICENPSWLGSQEYPTSMRLINVKDMCIVNARPEWKYVCLSYVWGPPSLQQNVKATKATIDDLEATGGLLRVLLPRTLSDAIKFVRDLGEMYLWVDALCIVQDDHHEKLAQISQMDLIYSRALCTLAVVYGDDCNSGIPHLYRKVRSSRQAHVLISPELALMAERYHGMYQNDEEWAKRGWTYQELQLSRRVIMAFKDMLHWRCECDCWNEARCLEPSSSVSIACTNILSNSLNMTFFFPRFNLGSLGAHVYYFNDVRKFTDDGDAMAAFNGILKRIEYVSGTGFHWGLPRKDFHFFLLWSDETRNGWRRNRRRKSPCKILSARGNLHSVQLPSWSWVGWYTRLYAPAVIYDKEGAAELMKKMIPKPSTWASEWYRLDADGKLSKIDSEQPQDKINEVISPSWVGRPIDCNGIIAGEIGQDTGCIISQTSYARCRIRVKLFDDITRRSGREPRDGKIYDLIGDDGQVLGQVEAIDTIAPVENWDEANMKEEEENGRVMDFIVISRELSGPGSHSDSDELDFEENGYSLNLMMIEWKGGEGDVASRRGIFKMHEELWIQCSPVWRRITLG